MSSLLAATASVGEMAVPTHPRAIWAFSDSRKHLSITLLRLEFVVVYMVEPNLIGSSVQELRSVTLLEY